jgi:hypothetical protein
MYIVFSDIEQALEGIVNFGSTGTTRYGSTSGGIELSPDRVLEYINQGEAYVLRKLFTLYSIPLTSSINGGTTLDDFTDMTKYNLKALFIDSTCVRIVTYLFAQQGNTIQLRNYLVDLKARLEENLEISLQKDISGGIVYPAYPDLVLSGKYLTRDQNPVLSVSTGSKMPLYSTIQALKKF